jgi:hypothetical protein
MSSRSFICAVAERAQEERDVDVASGVGNREHHRHLGVKLGIALLLEVVSGIEIQPVFAGGEPTFRQLSDAAVGVGLVPADD